MQINELEIYTSKLQAQTKFYSRVLELDIIEKSELSISFKIGNSILKLTYREKITPYHYAINIPANQEKEALNWLKKRVTILKDENEEIQYFDFWNAHAIYFYDAEKNIVELIARKSLKNNSKKKFNNNSLLEISEIGLPTSDIEQEYKILNEATDIQIYSGSFQGFCAIGDEHGLFIVINKQVKKDWYPTQDLPMSSDFKINFNEKEKEYTFKYINEKLKRL